MTPINDLFKWVDKNNPRQTQWAYNYICEFQRVIPEERPPYDGLIALTINLPSNDPFIKDMARKMRAAWNQKKHRDSRKNTKSYAFVMNTGIQKKLGSLAKTHKMTNNETLELLIEMGFNYEQRAKAAAKEVKREKEERKKKRADKTFVEALALGESNKILNSQQYKALDAKHIHLEEEHENIMEERNALASRIKELEEKCKNLEEHIRQEDQMHHNLKKNLEGLLKQNQTNLPRQDINLKTTDS